MKTTLRCAAFAVFIALFTFPLLGSAGNLNMADISRKAASTTYKVYFKPNGGTGKMSTQKLTVNKAASLSPNRFTRKGYVFIGWSTSKSGSVAYKNKQSVKNLAKGGGKVTLYAQWAVKTYLVAFFANGGSGSMSLQKMTYGKAANLNANAFTRKGYSFSGWAKTSKGKRAYKNKASVKNLTRKGTTIKLFAVWKVKTVSSDATSTDDAIDFSTLDWAYGGVDGSYAQISKDARISGLKASNSGLSFSWASGGCQDLGASSASDASCIACLFCYSGGKWTGGKFDWISTDNTAPKFTNITDDQYKGWSGSALASAEEYAFVILKKDLSARTNIIRVKSPGYSSSSSSSSTSSTGVDEVDFSLFQWNYGGFNGSSAKLAAKPRISDLKVSNDGMSYSWKSGGCENLGASSAGDAACLACLFCYYKGKWIGGKFDWISTSRRSRDFENIKDKYCGWSPTVFSKAEAYAFVIVSANGKSRTNVIRCGK